MSHKPHQIEVANTSPSETMRANEILIETAKTGKATAVVAVMSIFSEKRCKLWSANRGNEKPSCQKAESVIFPEGNTRVPRKLSQKSREGRIHLEISA